jgi:serine protease Do
MAIGLRPTGIAICCAMLLSSAAIDKRLDASSAAVPTDALREMNDSIERLVGRVSPSVVQVIAVAHNGFEDAFANRTLSAPSTIGSGIIVDPAGYIVTNEHVIAGADEIAVIVSASSQGRSKGILAALPQMFKARIVGVAPEVDLAVLSIDASGLPSLPWADYDALRQGELVFAFGSPGGLRDSVTMGIVSAVARQTDPENALVYVQTDAAINPGNSGGPLVNIDGEVVGLNTFIATSSGGSEGLGFALPSAIVSVVYSQLREFGHVRRASIGVAVESLPPALAARLGMSPDSGFLVSAVVPGDPADAAGLRRGDVVTAIDGKPVDRLTMASFYVFLFGVRDGQPIRLSIRRENDVLEIVATAIVPAASGVAPN